MDDSHTDAVPSLVSVAANILHWRGRNGKQFLYLPQSGLIRPVLAIWTFATIGTGILHVANVIPTMF